VIREYPPLVNQFCLDLCHQVLTSLKISHEKAELSHEVISISRGLLRKVERVILLNWADLDQKSEFRGTVPDITTLMVFMFDKFKAKETNYRQASIELWSNLVLKCPPQKTAMMKKPNDLKSWITDYYCKQVRSSTSIIQQIQVIDFSKSRKQSKEGQKDRLVEMRQSLD